MSEKHKGLRFNEGKTRYDLLPPHAIEGMANVLTYGANKYEPRNWEKGMSWSNVIASLKRHLAAIEKGEDYDNETGLLHAYHVMCNAAFLSEYYTIYPHGDDRVINSVSNFKIGLDIDDVLSDFVNYYCFTEKKEIPKFWSFDRDIAENLIKKDSDWWLNMPVKINPNEINFEPQCYITSRQFVSKETTQKWLDLNGFPHKPLFVVSSVEDKVKVAKDNGLDIFIDDRYENYKAMNDAGIFCYLFTAKHNEKYNVGHRRINNLKL